MYLLAVILVAMWLLGYVTSYTLGGLIHVLLLIAIIVVLLRIIQGKKVLSWSRGRDGSPSRPRRHTLLG